MTSNGSNLEELRVKQEHDEHALWISFNFEDFGYQWKPDSRAVET